MCEALEAIMDRREEKIRKITEDRTNNLTLKLAELGRIDDIINAAKDKAYQYQLFEEFGL